MKNRPFTRTLRHAAWLLTIAAVTVATTAQACPGCKQNTEGKGGISLSGASIGFSVSIFFMIFMVVAALGYLGFLMYRSCKVLAERDRALLDDDLLSPATAMVERPEIVSALPQPA